MRHNKIYKNYFLEILKNFFLVLFSLSVIAITVRAVNFLDLVVENGYSISTYFKYSLLNVFGIAPKFIPFSFLISISLFLLKHKRDSEFIILWTSGVQKINLVNLILVISIFILFINLLFSSLITPFALNKSRQLLQSKDFNFFLPTVKTQQFSDSFKGFTFIVEEKINNEIKNIFLHDKGSNLSNLSSNKSETVETVITAEKGLIENEKMFLFNGELISNKKDSSNEVLKFDQLDVDLSDLQTTTIKEPKIQETSSLKLLLCFLNKLDDKKYCNKNFNKEIISTLNRRFVIPLYIPVITLCCSLLLLRTRKSYLSPYLIFFYSFVILLFTELGVRYTGINNIILTIFIILPFLLLIMLYFFMILKFNKENKIYE
tara:strand:+ start:1356 stop:2480 length:1125 start_codon:yes stop_codon:yes gene_type:complete